MKLHPPKKKKGDPGTGPLPVKKHHVVVPDPVVTRKIEDQPTWVHNHPRTRFQPMQEYTFSSVKWNTGAVARFEGREPVRPGRVQVPPDTTHANVERPPHVDPGSEAPPAKTLKPA